MKQVLIAIFLLSSICSIAQQDSIKTNPKLKFLFGFDSRNSFIENKSSKIYGIRIGMQLKNPKVRVGLGVYNMQNRLKRTNEKVKEVDKRVDTLQINYSYVGAFYEYVWLDKNNFEISSPFLIGFGKVERSHFNATREFIKLPKTNIVIFEASLAAHYKFLPWLGLGSGFGYNVVLSGNPEISRAFNSPFYVLKVKLFLGELYRGLKKKH